MINVDVIIGSKNWKKRLKNPNILFNKLIKLFPAKYQFYKRKANLTVLLSNNKDIKILNKKFRNKDKATDILSFPFENKINLEKKFYLGDIIISYNFMNSPKTLSSLEFKDKVIKTFIHGFLHLL